MHCLATEMAESVHSITTTKLTRFGGDRSPWSEFKLRFIGLLVSSKIRFVLTDTRPTEGDEAISKWNDANISLYYKLIEFTSAGPFSIVQSVEDENVVKAWQLLLGRYERRSTADALSLLT